MDGDICRHLDLLFTLAVLPSRPGYSGTMLFCVPHLLNELVEVFSFIYAVFVCSAGHRYEWQWNTFQHCCCCFGFGFCGLNDVETASSVVSAIYIGVPL